MIVRILGEGQRELAEADLDPLNRLDEELQRAVDEGDTGDFASALSALLEQVRATGRPLPIDSLEPSELVLPPADATLDDVRDMLGDEGLIPG